MVKKSLFILLTLLLASCGSQNTGDMSRSSVSGSSAKEAIASRSAASVEAPAPTVSSILAEAETGTYKKGELLVRYKTGTTAEAASRVNATMGARAIRRFSLVNVDQVKLPDGVSVKNAIAQYMQDPDVLYAEPNYVGHVMWVPNDTYFTPDQWALDNTGTFASGTEGDDIKAPQAWDTTQGSRDIIVAVIDSGVDYNHPDLVNNIWTNPGDDCNNGVDDDGDNYADDCRGWNFTDNTNDPMDDLGHGTHVAGIIGAVGNNGMGIAGVMWKVRIMPLKIVGDYGPDICGEGEDFCYYVSDEISAIKYAVAKGARIINASYGGNSYSHAEYDAISAAKDAGVLFIAAAGNGGLDTIGDNNDINPIYPAGYNLPNIIAVAATDQNDQRASFSDYGLNSVQVAAPGVYILSTVPTAGIADSFTSFCTGSFFAGYDFCSGTSMAAPHVAGLAGLIESYYGHFDYQQVRATILRYVDPLPSLQGWVQSGGRVDAYKAISALIAPTNLVASSTLPSEVSLTWTDNATGEDGYTIERKAEGGDYATVGTLGPDVTSYTDSSASGDTTYTYRVTAFNNIGQSMDSGTNVATVTTPASAPPPPSTTGSGGCSISTRPDNTTALGDIAVFLLPLILLFILKRTRRDKV